MKSVSLKNQLFKSFLMRTLCSMNKNKNCERIDEINKQKHFAPHSPILKYPKNMQILNYQKFY